MTIYSLILLLLFANLLSQIDCGSVCYSCTGMAENDSCHNVATCQDDEICFTQKYQTEDNKTRFDVGCSYPELCRKDSIGTIFGKRAGLGHVLCHHCCTENVCNSAFTCTDNFKAPSLSCMYCSGIDMVDKCNTTITCTSDEVCFIQKYRTPMNQVKYDLGCKRSTICLNGYFSNSFGRRSNNEKHLLCESCCGGSALCNSDLVCSHHNQSTVNASCTSTNGCLSNLLCLSGKCRCPTQDYYWSTDRCKIYLNVDQGCISSNECRTPHICLDNVCKCSTDKYWDGLKCRLKKQPNSSCKTSQECSMTLFCIHGVCKCDRIEYWTGRNCSTRKNLNSSCKQTEECKDFLYCINGYCSCFDTANDYWNGTVCIQKKTQGKACFNSEECSGLLVCYSIEPHGSNKTVCLPAPTDCADIPFVQSDVFTIYTNDIQHPMQVNCVVEAGMKWTVIQRRLDGTTGFYRDWASYKKGFGDVTREYWLGNDNIHKIVSSRSYTLRIDVENFSGEKRYAEYTSFHVGDESSNYTLNIGGYSGTAGNFMMHSNGHQFSTTDRDNDDFGSGKCTDLREGCFWYGYCTQANLNGVYYPGGNVGSNIDCIFVWTWAIGYTDPMKTVVMKIK